MQYFFKVVLRYYCHNVPLCFLVGLTFIPCTVSFVQPELSLYAKTFFARTDEATPEDLSEAFDALAAEGRAMLDRAGVVKERQKLILTVDARYTRQSYELVVPVPDPPFGPDVMNRIAEAFHDRHAQTYGHARRDEVVQMVNVRLSAVGEIPTIRLGQTTGDGAAETGTRRVWLRQHGEAVAHILRRENMSSGQTVPGAAVIESLESTILVPPGWTARMDDDGFLHLDRMEASV